MGLNGPILNGGVDLGYVGYIVCPMEYTKHHISTTYTNIDTPHYCVDSLCTIVRWTDAWFGVWGPGLSWSVSYRQHSINSNTWIGGPAFCVGGQCLSDGSGINGDTGEEKIFEGGYTSSGGYVWLQDDDVIGGMYSDKWNVEFYPQDDLTAASYYFCSNNCQETTFLINKQFLPLYER